jgi:hypothetical protein
MQRHERTPIYGGYPMSSYAELDKRLWTTCLCTVCFPIDTPNLIWEVRGIIGTGDRKVSRKPDKHLGITVLYKDRGNGEIEIKEGRRDRRGGARYSGTFLTTLRRG